MSGEEHGERMISVADLLVAMRERKVEMSNVFGEGSPAVDFR